jgi:hypothetical protein
VTETFETWDLPEGVYLLGYPRLGQRLLVRGLYHSLFDEWWRNEQDYAMGTPGTGKSMFLVYALLRLARDLPSKIVVFQTTDGERIRFHPEGVWEGSANLWSDEIKNGTCVYLVDGGKLSSPVFKACPTLLVSSPNKEVYGRFKKNLHDREPMISTVFSLGEMLAVRELRPDVAKTLTVAQVHEVYLTLGGVPRRLLAWAHDKSGNPEVHVQRSFGVCNLRICRDAAEHAIASEAKVSHQLMHIHPVTDELRRFVLKFASNYVAREFAERYFQHQQQELKEWLASSESLPAFPTLRGVLFEGFAIQRLIEGGEFRFRELREDGTGDVGTMLVPPAPESLFRRLDDISSVCDSSVTLDTDRKTRTNGNRKKSQTAQGRYWE